MLTNAERVLLAVFVKAFREGEASATFEGERVAVRMRFKMYGLAQKVRKADVMEFSEEERFAVEEVSIRLEGAKMVCTNVAMSEAFKALVEQTGVEVVTQQVEDKTVTEAAMERFRALGLLKDDDA